MCIICDLGESFYKLKEISDESEELYFDGRRNVLSIKCVNIKSIEKLPEFISHLFLFKCPNLEFIYPSKSIVIMDLRYCDKIIFTELPENLVYFDCELNMLKTLPELPRKLKKLLCGYNDLEYIPMIIP